MQVLQEAPTGKTLNVTLLEPKMKHPTIFNWFDELQPGEAFTILNDHDPKPLYYQMIAERGNVFSWEYLQKGPVWWQVVIRKNDEGQGPTLGELVAADIRKAEVFKKYGIDFCCGGKKSLKQACEEKNLDPGQVENELQQVSQQATTPVFDFNRWEPDFLADYIFNQHHTYYYTEGPVIADLVHKVAEHHGESFPHLVQVAEMYRVLQHELQSHFMKEEKVLFPMIKKMMEAKRSGSRLPEELRGVNSPIQVMEADHDAAGDILKAIREATSDYAVPAGACNSFRLLYHKLEALETDPHTHIHLENNILFPKAAQLEKQLLN